MGASGYLWVSVGINGDMDVATVLFTGTFERSLDGKGRVLLPKKLRVVLSDCQTLYLTPGTDNCLELHTNESLDRLAKASAKSNLNSKAVKSFSRLFYAQAEQVEIDSQGRVRVPNRLLKWANLESEIAIVGVGVNWELWDAETWKAYFAGHSGDFDWVHQSTFDGTIEEEGNVDKPRTAKPK